MQNMAQQPGRGQVYFFRQRERLHVQTRTLHKRVEKEFSGHSKPHRPQRSLPQKG
jgi:hypothetical protein